MKELNEYKAEIFRRSELKLKKRKEGRRRALALSISLCALLMTAAIVIPPMLYFGKSTQPSGKDTETDRAQSPALVHSYVLAEITTSGKVRSISEPHTLTEIHYQVSRAFFCETCSDKESTVTEAPDSETSGTTEQTKDQSTLPPPSAPPIVVTPPWSKPQPKEYKITLVEKDGSSVSYVLFEDTLTDENGRTVILSEDALDALCNALGIKKGE